MSKGKAENYQLYADEDAEQLKLYFFDENAKTVMATWKRVWKFLYKLNIHLYSPVLPSLGIYPSEMKSYDYTEGFT